MVRGRSTAPGPGQCGGGFIRCDVTRGKLGRRRPWTASDSPERPYPEDVSEYHLKDMVTISYGPLSDLETSRGAEEQILVLPDLEVWHLPLHTPISP